MNWQKIETAPTDYREILCGFQGQFRWLSFVAVARGADTQQAGYARPTHWTHIEPPSF
jgi:hypothetical protein